MRLPQLLLVIFFGAPNILFGQMKGWSANPALHTGLITQHTSKLTIDNSGVTVGVSCNFQFQTYGTKVWQQLHNYPQVGLETAYFRFGNPSQLGQAFGLLPNLTFTFIDKPSWKFRSTVGMGIGWLTKHYDPINNPQANAIGSHLNNYTSFRFFVEREWKPSWKWMTGISFSHFSNGSTQLPNYGLNIPALLLSFNYSPTPLKAQDFRIIDSIPRFRKWGLMVEASAARQELFRPNGPKYPVYNLAFAVTFRRKYHHRNFLGTEFEYNYFVYNFYNFYKFLEQYDERQTKRTGRRIMIFGGHDFEFGQTSFGIQAGVYIGPDKYLLQNPWYNKLSLKYHFHLFGENGIKPYLALHMKAHMAIAEYISAGVGFKW